MSLLPLNTSTTAFCSAVNSLPSSFCATSAIRFSTLEPIALVRSSRFCDTLSATSNTLSRLVARSADGMALSSKGVMTPSVNCVGMPLPTMVCDNWSVSGILYVSGNPVTLASTLGDALSTLPSGIIMMSPPPVVSVGRSSSAKACPTVLLA